MQQPSEWQNLRPITLSKSPPVNSTLEVGSIVLVRYQPRPIDPAPFAIGQVLSIDTTLNTVKLWWMGNDHLNIFGAQRMGYYYKTTNKLYYSDTPRHSSHPRYTTTTTEQHIPTTDI